MEYIFFVFDREIQVILAVFVRCIRCPHLPAGPGDILNVQGYTMNSDFTTDAIHGQHVVIFHIKMSSFVILSRVGLDVVRRINVDPAIENVGRRVGGEDMRNQRFRYWFWQLFGYRILRYRVCCLVSHVGLFTLTGIGYKSNGKEHCAGEFKV